MCDGENDLWQVSYDPKKLSFFCLAQIKSQIVNRRKLKKADKLITDFETLFNEFTAHTYDFNNVSQMHSILSQAYNENPYAAGYIFGVIYVIKWGRLYASEYNKLIKTSGNCYHTIIATIDADGTRHEYCLKFVKCSEQQQGDRDNSVIENLNYQYINSSLKHIDIAPMYVGSFIAKCTEPIIVNNNSVDVRWMIPDQFSMDSRSEPGSNGYYVSIYTLVPGASLYYCITKYMGDQFDMVAKALIAFVEQIRELGVLHGFVHNDLHNVNIRYNTATNRIQLIDFGRSLIYRLNYDTNRLDQTTREFAIYGQRKYIPRLNKRTPVEISSYKDVLSLIGPYVPRSLNEPKMLFNVPIFERRFISAIIDLMILTATSTVIESVWSMCKPMFNCDNQSVVIPVYDPATTLDDNVTRVLNILSDLTQQILNSKASSRYYLEGACCWVVYIYLFAFSENRIYDEQIKDSANVRQNLKKNICISENKIPLTYPLMNDKNGNIHPNMDVVEDLLICIARNVPYFSYLTDPFSYSSLGGGRVPRKKIRGGGFIDSDDASESCTRLSEGVMIFDAYDENGGLPKDNIRDFANEEEVVVGGGANKIKFNGKTYALRTGARGGKYIVVAGKKKYV